MWIPPFMFDEVRTDEFMKVVTVWYAKQVDDRISWILLPNNMFDNIHKK